MLQEGKNYIKNLVHANLSGEELNKLCHKLKELYEKGYSIEDVSISLELSSSSVVAMRKELNIIKCKGLET